LVHSNFIGHKWALREEGHGRPRRSWAAVFDDKAVENSAVEAGVLRS